MQKDITGRADIEQLINAFYGKVRQDEVIGYIFNDVAKVDWETHLPVMYDFWESTLFHRSGYHGNTMQVHLDLHERTPLTKEHFDRWLALFNATVDELFSGEMANQVKTRALSIATMIQFKIHAKGGLL